MQQVAGHRRQAGLRAGECGACTVLVGGEPRYACMMLAVEVEGAEVVMVEGLLDGETLGPVQQAFVEKDGFQCGFCTSGQVMAVEGLLRKRQDPTPDEIREGLSGNLCRCGAYAHIFESERRGEVSHDRDPARTLGRDEGGGQAPPLRRRLRARERQRRLRDRRHVPDMLHAAIVRCRHPHAPVKKVDTSKAERRPGVRAVLTGDSPGAKLPWYFEEKGPPSLLLDPHCRYEGEEVAAVAAETPQQAYEAARAVAVEYEELPFVVDYADALKPGAPAVHEGGNRSGEPDKYERGDVAKGFAEAEVVVERTFKTPCEIRTLEEPHGSVAKRDGGRLTVWDTNQGVFDVRGGLGQWLQLPLTSVRVISKYRGTASAARSSRASTR